MPKSIQAVVAAFNRGCDDLTLVQRYHAAIYDTSCDEVSCWLSTRLLNAIDTAEENLIHAR